MLLMLCSGRKSESGSMQDKETCWRERVCTLGFTESGEAEVHVFDSKNGHWGFQEVAEGFTIEGPSSGLCTLLTKPAT